MAVATLTVETVDVDGLELSTGSYTAATDTPDGFQFINDGNTFVHIKNADDGAGTATIDVPQPCSYGGTTVHDVDVTLTNAKDYLLGPFSKHKYNDEDGKVTIRIVPNSDVTDFSARAIKFSWS